MTIGYMLERYLDQLVRELKLGEPLKENDTAELTVNSGLKITLRGLEPGVLFFSPVTTVPQKNRDTIFKRAMQANFLGQGTGGAVLGMDEEEKYLTLSLTLPYEMNYQRFKDALSDFANYVDYWKKEVKRKELE